MLIFFSVCVAVGAASNYSLEALATLWVAGAGSVFIARLGLSAVIRRLAHDGVLGRKMVVLGSGEKARRVLAQTTEAQPYLVTVVGVFADNATTEARLEGVPVLGGIDRAFDYCRTHGVDEVMLAMPWREDDTLVALVDKLKELPIHVHLCADLAGYVIASHSVTGARRDIPTFEILRRPISGWSSALKAIEDYVLASFILILVSPLLAAIAIAIKLDSRGPVFFMQKRLGFNNREFYIYKFRSMYVAANSGEAVRQATRGDPRVTRVGRFIRATSLDELPQLLNILDGTMSLVGPRPHALSHNEEYGQRIRGYFSRHRVKPGITGWAQVNGLRGETESIEKMEARIRHDIYYTENWSIIFDLRVLMLTVATVLFHKNAY